MSIKEFLDKYEKTKAIKEILKNKKSYSDEIVKNAEKSFYKIYLEVLDSNLTNKELLIKELEEIKNYLPKNSNQNNSLISILGLTLLIYFVSSYIYKKIKNNYGSKNEN